MSELLSASKREFGRMLTSATVSTRKSIGVFEIRAVMKKELRVTGWNEEYIVDVSEPGVTETSPHFPVC